jgi:predicted transcriptional regulator
MMDIIESSTLIIITLGSYLIGFVLTLLILRYLATRKEEERSKDERDYYEKALLDIMIRLNILELRMKERLISQQISQNITEYHKSDEVKSDIDNIELKVLSLLRDGSKTSREIETSIKRSREHTARLMKILYDKGYVNRDENTKPYKYTLTENGIKILTQLENS